LKQEKINLDRKIRKILERLNHEQGIKTFISSDSSTFASVRKINKLVNFDFRKLDKI